MEQFKTGDTIEHRLMPGFTMSVLEAKPCETDSGRPEPHLQYKVTDPEGNEDWVCAYDVQRPGEGLAWGPGDTQVPPAVTGNPDARRLASDRDWFGWLTLENFEAAADRIRRLLDGRSYTWVACNEGLRAYFPEVRTGQRLEHRSAASGNAVNAKLLSPGHGHITVVDSYGAWGLSTSIPDQAAARKLDHDAACKAGPYLAFHRAMGSRPDRLEIEHFAPVGSRLYWVVAVEPESEDDD